MSEQSDSFAPDDNDLLWDPNRYARSVNVTRRGPLFIVDGYQRYATTSACKPLLPLRRNLLKKARVVVPFMKAQRKSNKVESFADFGCNTGYFLASAKAMGFKDVYGYDLDTDVAEVYSQTFMDGVTFRTERVQDVTSITDVTLAMSLFHWLVGQADDESNAIDEVLAQFSAISRVVAIVELVTSDDPLVKEHGHYHIRVDEEVFVEHARRHFAEVQKIGESSPTRLIYALFADRQG